MFGPAVGKRHDSGMLAESVLLGDLQRYSHSPAGQPLCVHGDPAYPISVHMQHLFAGPELTRIQKEYYTAMSSVRGSAEWMFGDTANYFALCIAYKCQDMPLQSVTSSYFGSDPPELQVCVQ